MTLQKHAYIFGTFFTAKTLVQKFIDRLKKEAMWCFIGGIEKTQSEKEHYHFVAYNKKRPKWGWIAREFKVHFEGCISPKDAIEYCKGYKDGKFKDGVGENAFQEEYGTRPRLCVSNPIEVAADYRKLDDEDAA